MSIEHFLPVIWDHISYLVTMETHIPIIFTKNGHRCKNLISGFEHTKQRENIISGSENINKKCVFDHFSPYHHNHGFSPNMSINSK